MIPYINDHPIQIAACSSRTSWEVLTLTLYLMMFLTHVQKGVPVAIINLKFNVTNSSVSLLYFGLVEGKNFDFETSKKNFVFFTYLSQILLQIDARNISIKYTK